MKHNLPIQKIEEVVYYQFKFVAATIKKGLFESVRLPYLGKFHVNPNRIKYLNEGTTNSNRK